MKTVYLFGAGFSKDVADGPLMAECFPRMVEACDQREKQASSCPGHVSSGDRNTDLVSRAHLVLIKLAQCFRRSAPDPQEGMARLVSGVSMLKGNIELLATLADLLRRVREREFDCLGLSQYDNASSLIPGIWKADIEALWAFIHEFLPAALYGLSVLDEKKGLFQAFASRLQPENDTLVTFNYDVVLERALWEFGMWTPNAGYLVLEHFEAHFNDDVTGAVLSNLNPSRHRILKLHGSVNWERSRGSGPPWVSLQNREELGQPWCFTGLGDKLGMQPLSHREHVSWAYQNVLVAPSLVKDIGAEPLLATNWRACQRALCEADQLVAIGYSFPEQDNASRLLLGLLRDDARLILIGPHASLIADSVKHLVEREQHHDLGFSDWVREGCPGTEET